MKTIAKIITAIAVNALALWGASAYIQGFHIAGGPTKTIALAFIFTLLNFILKPILKLALGPVILLTLGLGLIVVNALILYILPLIANSIDFLQGSIKIETITALFWGTLLIGAVNFIFHIADRKT